MSVITRIALAPLAAVTAAYAVLRPEGSGRRSARRAAVVVAAVPLLVLSISACSSSDSDSASGTGSSSPSTSPTAQADCTEKAILGALPEGAEMEKYTCATVGDTEWAAARVSPGDTVFFLQWNGSTWDVSTSDEVCGTASAGLPDSLLSYCDAPSASSAASSSASSSAAACTSKAILGALPDGAKMKKYTCATVGKTEWAAARVSPGDTVFFLQWNGSTWDVSTSDEVCGTASAGLPQSLLAYCTS